jgi:hypothetical protein
MTDTTAQTGVDTAPAPEAAPEPKKAPTAREAVEKAAAEVAVREEKGTTETEKALRVLKGEPEEQPEPKAKPKAKAEPKPEPEAKKAETKPKETEPKEAETKTAQRGPDGKFQSSQPKDEAETEAASDDDDDDDEEDERAPPKRFSKQAQAEWEKAPESVRHETRRAIREIEQGLVEHQERSTRWKNEIEPYEQLARSYGLDGVKGVLSDYEGMARQMASDPIVVFDTLAKRHGFTLEQIAGHVLRQDIDDYAQKAGQQIVSLQKQVQALQAEVNETRAEKARSVQSFVSEFAQKNPRYAELESTISWIIATNGVDRSDPKKALKEAYAMADRLKPAPAETSFPQPAASAIRNNLSAQTAVASKSVTGAPGQGSNPANRKLSSSPRDALMSAARRTGIA